MMTLPVILARSVPILWSQGYGRGRHEADCAAIVGGMLTSTVLALAVIPGVYSLWRERELVSATPARRRVTKDSSGRTRCCHFYWKYPVTRRTRILIAFAVSPDGVRWLQINQECKRGCKGRRCS